MEFKAGYQLVYDNPNDIIEAANIKTGGNPTYDVSDFLEIYPNFEQIINSKIPSAVTDMYISFANSCVSQKRWGEQWKLGMALFLAHFLTIYLQGEVNEDATSREILAAGQARGLITSKSVGDVSVNYDFSSAVTGVESWGQFNTTAYGLQFANIAKLLGKGGMYLW